MAVKEYYRGDSIRCTASVTMIANVATNPTVSIVIRIKSPPDTRVITDVAMTNLATGSYVYVYDTLATNVLGEYFFEIVATDGAGSDVTIQDGSFNLRERRA